jgi:hypothetical protein
MKKYVIYGRGTDDRIVASNPKKLEPDLMIEFTE